MAEVCSCNDNVSYTGHHGMVQGSGDEAVAVCVACLKNAQEDKQADLKSEVADGSSICEGCAIVISKGRLVSPAMDINVNGEVVHVEANYSYPDGWCGICSSVKEGHPKCYKCLAAAAQEN